MRKDAAIKYATITVLLIIFVILVQASRQPDTFLVERSVIMAAPAERVFPHIADLRAWSAWSPYEKLDRNMKKTFNGTSGAAGSSYYWNGNAQAGEGTITVRETMSPSKVTMQLDMLKPIEGHNVVEFNLEPAEGGTRVTWAMRGPMTTLSKVIGVFMSMDRMIGQDFADGLASLKTQVERP